MNDLDTRHALLAVAVREQRERLILLGGVSARDRLLVSLPLALRRTRR